ncbi:MAG: hypothetical protein KF819_39095 [Labilithrix sp.]|nr:hypothetical protein [Labilithrix sp.]
MAATRSREVALADRSHDNHRASGVFRRGSREDSPPLPRLRASPAPAAPADRFADRALRITGAVSLVGFPAAGALFIAGAVPIGVYFAFSAATFVALLISLVPSDAWTEAFGARRDRTSRAT